jgi:hypothetical protein
MRFTIKLQQKCQDVAPPTLSDHRCRPTRTGTVTVTATVIAISILAVVIPIRTAATTDPILPTADSTAAVREHCRRCRVGGLICGVVIDSNVIAADAPEASLLPPSSAMDPTAVAMTKTLDGDGNGGDGDSDDNNNGDDNSNGNGGGGVQRMQRR